MILFRIVLVAVLVPIWALFGLSAIAFASTVEVPLTDAQLEVIGFGPTRLEDLQSAATVVLLAGLGLHGVVWLLTSRAVASMAGSVGGIVASVAGGLAAAGLALAPASERTEVLAQLVRPVAIAVIAAISVALGFRAFLAHTGRWNYRRVTYDAMDDGWGDGWGDGD